MNLHPGILYTNRFTSREIPRHISVPMNLYIFSHRKIMKTLLKFLRPEKKSCGSNDDDGGCRTGMGRSSLKGLMVLVPSGDEGC